MFFLKKALLGFAAFVLILWGGAGTQSNSTLLQGGGFIGLIVGLIVLYIFAKMAWRAMGCLPSILLIAAIVVFILYAIGGFRNGIGNVGANLKNFLGQASVQNTSGQGNAKGVINLINDEDFDKPITENFSDSIADNKEIQAPAPQKQAAQQPAAVQNTAEDQGMFQKLMGVFGGSDGSSAPANGFNPENFPAIYGPAKVISGDTLQINGRYFRLYGVDAPENNQSCADSTGRSYRCGSQATAWLRSWLQNNELECRVMQKDSKGNMVGTCSLGAYDLGAALVNAGWAVAYVKYTDVYVPYQLQAQENRNGLWQGEFYMPWDWRTLQARKPKVKIIKQKQERKRTLLSPF